MEHCHLWIEEKQCDRSRESRSQASKLRAKSQEPNRKQKCRPQTSVLRSAFCLPIDGHKHVGAILPAKPLSSARSRQHAPDFQGRPTSMLALTSPQILCPSSSHANTPRIFKAGQRPCWRRPPRKSFALRRVTPTCPGFSRPAGVIVGVDLPANPLPSARSRQQAQAYSCGPYH